MSKKLNETSKIVYGVVNADVVTARTSATFVAVKDFKRVRGIAISGTVAQTKELTVEILQATDAAGSGAKLAGTKGTFVAPTGGALGLVETEIETNQLDQANGFVYVGVRVDSDNGSALVGSALLELGEPSYSPIA